MGLSRIAVSTPKPAERVCRSRMARRARGKSRGQEANEPPISRGKPTVTESSSADSSALPPDLATVVAAWDRLPEVVRAGILAMVKASGW
jgi:hypothetical protein